MYSKNMDFLRQHHRTLWQLVREYEERIDDFPAQVLASKLGQDVPTVQVHRDGRWLLLHSKYDPVQEAERIAGQYVEEIAKYDHIFFYGLGMGYHVQAIMEKFPDKTYTLYEPNPYIFYHFITHRDIKTFKWPSIKHFFIETSTESGRQFITQFAAVVKDKVLLIPLPSYERIFKEQYQQFNQQFKTAIIDKRQEYHVNLAFSKRWVINSLVNFPKVLQTTNIFERKKALQGKPVIIVSAGPSLEDEYDNLRYIKVHGLAYIFAVGSANKALIAKGIYPDAVCTYDPQKHNYLVFSRLYEENITSIPMIFGTSVGYETIEKYQGPKLHMITSQDTVSQYYLQMAENKRTDFVYDAPSIAIVTFQLLCKLGASLIILVGQNFAFRNNQYYSADVEYKSRTYKVKEEDLKEQLYVEDVHGNQVLTNRGFNVMRQNLEQYIKLYAHQKVINTTQGGAKIHGAPFMPLSDVIKTYLQEKVVEENWYKPELDQDKDESNERLNVALAQAKKMERKIKEFRNLYEQMFQLMEEMQQAVRKKNLTKLDKLYGQFDRVVRRIDRNDFYVVYVQPIFRVEHELLAKKIENIRLESDPSRKVELIRESFGGYFLRCRLFAEGMIPSIRVMHQSLSTLQEIKSNQDSNWKRYPSDCGVFKFIGSWSRSSYTSNNSELPKIPYYVTQEKGAKIEFSFEGTSLRILASKRADRSANIAITIDGVTETFSQQDRLLSKDSAPIFHEVVYEKNGLTNERHNVVIQLLDEDLCTLDAVEIDEAGRIYHPDEVTTVEELAIGKRIRCHYTATYNKVGEFSGLGTETSAFIPPESSDQPDGDFYFIMVDEENGEKKLIADRNIQHSISWVTLSDFGLANKQGVNIKSLSNKSVEASIRLIYGGESEEDSTNEWDRYIIQSDLNGSIEAGSDSVWNWSSPQATWTNADKNIRNQNGIVMKPVRSMFLYKGVWYGTDAKYWKLTIFTNESNVVAFRPLLSLTLK